MQKLIFITALLTVGVCYGQLEMPDCPTSDLEFASWMSKVVKNCHQTMIIALRESKDNCENKVALVGPCLTTEKNKCTADLADDTVKGMIDESLGSLIQSTEGYSYIYCSTGPIMDIAMTTTLQCSPEMAAFRTDCCPPEMVAASTECHAPYLAIFNEDRVDVRLCNAYNTMVTCETGKVRELCTDADVMTVSMDEMTRRLGNYYCDDDDTPAGPGEENACPTSMLDFSPWLMKVITNCTKQLILELRKSKDNCVEKVGNVGTCIRAATDQCTEGLEDTDTVKTMIESTMSGIIEDSAKYSDIYCTTGPVMDITANTTVMGCSDEIRAASLACHAPFMDIFNADRVDVKLCEAYETMVTCETAEVKKFCTSASDSDISMDELSRRMGNLFCVEEDVGADDVDADDVDTLSATSVVVSFFTFILANVISMSFIL